MYLHEISMGTYISKHSDVGAIVRALQLDHAAYLDDVSSAQLTRVVQKLLAKAKPLANLPTADYNSVSESQLRLVKDKMDTVFNAHVVKPGKPGYEYDKQIEFKPTEASDWDDDDDG
ncbi:hypothetical protein AeMF1_014378 [Aphanomyces euteiches]|nr:hypothetical protein AeMF1_014378 [Aphanomyces euteiches]KAH9197547.1 hypothetical protein AeNC1_000497 [Aphanomyces euteiches]